MPPANQEGSSKRPLDHDGGEMTHKKKTSKKKTGAKKVTAATPTTGESEASSPALPMFRRLRLEAIFHPKFENEMQEQLIRQQMKERVANEKGYLEVSVKHSGSLLLWSGGERFYSKNSTDNIFTAAGQILLRQHYGRLDANSLFQECSEYIKKQRLTLSFEVVTSFLGDHGDRPQRDFLILTAAAYREKEQFLSTTELIELAQQFQLPHNDAWVFTTVDSCQALFDLYDASRETGVASNLVPALTSAADTHVSSMYPHTTFQGNVMEGIVIRFVPCRETASLQQAVERVQVAAAKSVERLQKTLDLPACPERYKDQSDASPVLKVDLRSLYQETRVVKAGDEEGFDYKVQELLHKSGSERKVERLSRALSSDIPVLAKKLSMASDPETRRIAKLIQSLGELNDRVQYSLVQESNTGRWLCTIHVYFDKTFQKYRKRKDKADMELFRGFVFELLEDENSKDEMTRAHKEEPPQQSYADPEEPLMLKMKLLPYMVRTFGCRNGLVRVKQGGPADFSRYTRGLLSKWNMSNEAKAQWQPFFDAWGRYAHACLEGKQSASMFSDTPLTSTNYLDHLIPFQESFESGSLSSEFSNSNNGSFKFSGVLVVVAATSETASSVADFVAEKMGGAKRVHGLKQLNSHFMELCCGSGNGQVVSAAVEEGSGKVRGLSKEYGDDITVLLFQFTDKDVAAADSKRIRGIAESWKKVKCRNVVSLPYDSLFQKGGQLEASDTFLSFVSNEAGREHPEEMPGLLVWFPGIPGCGKSCMVETEKQVRTRLKDMKGPARNLVVLSGDKTKGKYWPLVKQKKRRDTTSILLADKNAPSVSWDIVAGACAATKAVGVPVLPDGAALSTTEIAGTRHLDGRTSEKKHVYPFSLAYLAVCLARVMARSEGSHAGKLDKGTHRACMIVVMFYSLYRRVTADEFLGTMEYKFGSEGAMLATSPITLPFFKSPSPELPVELQEALVEALKWQFGCEQDKVDTTKKDSKELNDMEDHLRNLIEKYQQFLFDLAADEDATKQAFVYQFLEQVERCNSEEIHTGEAKAKTFYKLAAIDVDCRDVHNILIDLKGSAGEALKPFFDLILGDRALEDVFGVDDMDSRIVTATHVTLGHFKTVSQSEFRDIYDPLSGLVTNIKVTSLLWGKEAAALQVTCDNKTECGKEIPAPKNDFAHITVWFQKGASAVKSNLLPKLVETGEAQKLDFETPVSLRGTISLWES